jgi:hypothetical protein
LTAPTIMFVVKNRPPSEGVAVGNYRDGRSSAIKQPLVYSDTMAAAYIGQETTRLGGCRKSCMPGRLNILVILTYS